MANEPKAKKAPQKKTAAKKQAEKKSTAKKKPTPKPRSQQEKGKPAGYQQPRNEKGHLQGGPYEPGSEEAKNLSSHARRGIRWPMHPFARRFQTPDDLEGEIAAYFEQFYEQGRPFTWGGLAHFLGMRITALDKYKRGEKGETEEDRDKFKLLLDMAKEVIMVSKQEAGLGGAYNTAFVIFDLKHNHQWSDRTQQEMTGPDGEPLTTALHVSFRKSNKKPEDEQQGDE